jgi:hypothetical protein
MALILGGNGGGESQSAGSRLGGSLFSTEMLRVLSEASSGLEPRTARKGDQPLSG